MATCWPEMAKMCVLVPDAPESKLWFRARLGHEEPEVCFERLAVG